jgi:hypothetical protein
MFMQENLSENLMYHRMVCSLDRSRRVWGRMNYDYGKWNALNFTNK